MAMRYLTALFSALCASSQSDRNFSKILTISTLFTCYFLYTGYYQFPGGAWHFTTYAEVLAHGGVLQHHLSQRDAGYPLLLWLSLYPYTGSFVGITLLHALFSLLIPPMVYRIVERANPQVAYYTALAAILSLAPYQFMKFLHHDQMFLFFLILTLFCAERFLHHAQPRMIYAMTFAAIICGLARPAGNWMLLGILILFMCLKPKLWRHYVACVAIFLLTAWGYHLHRMQVFNISQNQVMPSYTGQQALFNIYLGSREFGITLSEDNSPHLEALIKRLRDAVAPVPIASLPVRNLIASRHYSEDFVDKLFNYHEVDPFIANFLAHPNYEYMELLSNIAQDDDRLFLNAAKDITTAYPSYTLQFVTRNMLHLLFLPGYGYQRDSLRPFGRSEYPPLLASVSTVSQTESLPERGLNEISHAASEHELWWLTYPQILKTPVRIFYIALYTMLSWLSIIPFLVAAWLVVQHGYCRLRRHTSRIETAGALHILPILLVVGAVFGYNALITAVFVGSQYRYHFFIIIPQIIGAGLGVTMIYRCWKPQFVRVEAIIKQYLVVHEETGSRWQDRLLKVGLALILAWPFFLYLWL